MGDPSDKLYLIVNNSTESSKAVKIKIIYSDSTTNPPEEPKEEFKNDGNPIGIDRKETIERILINSCENTEMIRYPKTDKDDKIYYEFEIKVKYKGNTISVVAVESDYIV